ncbi:MAG: hypothetical protein CVU21_05420 [Betaproteobacteria bacterium HGW-Betaproteobacteria-15]|nr:MAG: hypothetical protein CVU21_05420 [Betaproteobacteria bacterium HGW-Betaproteobacteria-15]
MGLILMHEVMDQRRTRGRPSGKAQVWREQGLRLHDLAFMRAVAQGQTTSAAAQRYLPEVMAEGRVANQYLRRVGQVAADTLVGMGDAVAAKAVRDWLQFSKSQANSTAYENPTVHQPVANVPSLDEFAEEIGAEDFSEREILELYQERYGEQVAAVLATQPVVSPSIAAVMRALGIVQSRGLVLPKPTDPLSLWVSERLALNLVDQGIELLQDLVAFINGHGRHWYTHVPGVGQDRAKRLVSWLVDHESYLELPVASRSRWDAGSVAGAGSIEKHMVYFSIPSAEQGWAGVSLRSYGPNALGAQSDLDAIETWLETLSFKSPHTRTAYARDAQRLLLWAHERSKTLSTLTVTDAAEHARFLVNPPSHWVTPLPTRRQDPDWRPMRGALSEASAARALAAIGHLYGFLVETGYLVANPFARIRKASKGAQSRHIDTTRSFRQEHLQALVAAVGVMPKGPARRRARALLMLMASTGVRIGETGGTWGDVIASTSDHEEDGQPVQAMCLRVIGKGQKERLLPLKPAVLSALQKHLDDRRVLEDQGLLQPCLLADTPLISVVAKPVGADLASSNGGLSVSGVHRVFKSLCKQAAKTCAEPRLQADFERATAHWLRHTFAHSVLRASGSDLPVTQQLLGHASLATTGIYVKADMSQRFKAVMGMPLMFDNARGQP